MFGVNFDPTFRLGDIVAIVAALGVGLGAYHNIKAILKLVGFRLDVIDATMEDLNKELKDVREEVSNGKVQDVKIERLEDDVARNSQMIFELQRGHGYVQRDIDGQYDRTGKIR